VAGTIDLRGAARSSRQPMARVASTPTWRTRARWSRLRGHSIPPRALRLKSYS